MRVLDAGVCSRCGRSRAESDSVVFVTFLGASSQTLASSSVGAKLFTTDGTTTSGVVLVRHQVRLPHRRVLYSICREALFHIWHLSNSSVFAGIDGAHGPRSSHPYTPSIGFDLGLPQRNLRPRSLLMHKAPRGSRSVASFALYYYY